jgi:hypothetical protein
VNRMSLGGRRLRQPMGRLRPVPEKIRQAELRRDVYELGRTENP